jgi:hypothetical protein
MAGFNRPRPIRRCLRDQRLTLLGQVDDQLLKDIGVSSAGHRLRIRNAIAKLGGQVRALDTRRIKRAENPCHWRGYRPLKSLSAYR